MARLLSTRAAALRCRLAPLALALAACAAFPDAGAPTSLWPTPTAGAVASAHPLATRVGVEVLDAGGNATDAAVATALALAVVYPQAGNLGGGGFAIVVPHDASRVPRALDFREVAPRDLSATDFLDEAGVYVAADWLASPLIVGVPGSPAGLWALHQAEGRLPWADLVAPAVALARDGFPVDAQLAKDLRAAGTRARLEADPAARERFYPGSHPLAEGALLVQADLAATLDRLGAEGPDGFYRGPVAAAIVQSLGSRGRLAAPDLADYRPVWREPLRGWFRGREVITMPPPSSGGLVLLQVLGVLDGLPLDAERDATLAGRAGAVADADAGISERALHWWIEAMRRAYADRAQHMGDPDFHPVPVAALLDPAWIAARRVSIGDRAEPGVAPWAPPPAESGTETTHLSVRDAAGNAVSMTTTLNTSFGTGILVPGAGFLLNNELDDFAIQAGAPNAYGLVGGSANALEPNKRPLSSMTPTVVRDAGEVVTLVVGSPGGPRIISSVLEVILRCLVYGQELEAAVAAPRVHQQWRPESSWLEPGWGAAAIEALEGRGHRFDPARATWSSVQAIRVPIGGRPTAVADPRRGGLGLVQGD